MTAASIQHEERLWTAVDVAAFLGVSKSWVYHAAEAGLLPYRRIGALIRFDPTEIREYGRKPPAASNVVPLRRK